VTRLDEDSAEADDTAEVVDEDRDGAVARVLTPADGVVWVICAVVLGTFWGDLRIGTAAVTGATSVLVAVGCERVATADERAVG